MSFSKQLYFLILLNDKLSKQLNQLCSQLLNFSPTRDERGYGKREKGGGGNRVASARVAIIPENESCLVAGTSHKLRLYRLTIPPFFLAISSPPSSVRLTPSSEDVHDATDQ